ncbi:MAG: extracellular solute-binding protein [Clostridium argentinense]|uniref:Extracellular solute-binding protein n=1 Tax=Clostridium faecium TaxID=2762223 RepID=A0ABR8YUQ4_9CLOT|nr:extracellular solute-binding protein [Clostridium faecium]MBD8048018.1 extracellular solute-binding protein [Clostridium faecium]MBS5822609.1 extracellular solute-binding protein [Clostridium argentinense]
MKSFLKKYNKYIIFTIIVLLGSFMYRIFLDSSREEKVTIPKEMEGRKVVNFWMMTATDSQLRENQISKFNASQDEIYVKFQTFKDLDYINRLKISLYSDEGPDIFQYGYTELIKNDKIADLKDLNLNLNKIGEDKLFYYDKNPIGIKLSGSNVKLAWNKEIFKECGLDPEKPPRTWDEVIEYALKIKEKNPDIIPFQFPLGKYESMKAVIGEPSLIDGTIYTSFWDYKQGKYDFSASKRILEVYKKMYDLGIIPEDFMEKDKKQVRRDFYFKESAMYLSTFEDKNNFYNAQPLDFPIGVEDIPKFNINDKAVRHYVDPFTYIVVNKETKEKDSVEKFLQWIVSDQVNREIMQLNKGLPLLLDNKDVNLGENPLNKYNDSDNYVVEKYDPTVFITYSQTGTLDEIYSAITGKKSIDEVISNLNKYYEEFYKVEVEKNKFNFDLYTDK